jgi:Acetylornithine deacetylase/Succinyl-diaminopimelate desuccinylase and related deacylases
MVKRLLQLIGLAVLIVAAVVVARAAMFTPKRVEVLKRAAFTPPSGAVERLSGAIRIPTISPSDSTQRDSAAFRAMHEYLVQSFPRVHATLTREAVGQDALLYKWAGTDPTLEPLVLMGHMDVVPIDPGALKLWTHSPFSGDVADGFIWGRGSLDDKATVMSLLEAAEMLIGEGFTPRRTIYFSFGADEELGGSKGAAVIAKLIKSRGIKPYLVLDEGGVVVDHAMPGVNPPVALIGIAEKGYETLELSVRGDGGHSSIPPKHTAAGILARAVTRLEDNPLPASIGPEVSQLFNSVGPEMPFGRRILFANRWLLDPILIRFLASRATTDAMLRTTTAVTMLEGSPKDNVLPSLARASVNFRIIPGESTTSVLAHAKKAIDDSAVHVTATGTTFEPSLPSVTSGPAWSGLQKTIAQIYPEAVVSPYLMMGATDSRYFRPLTPNVYRFMGARIDVDDRDRIHGTNERISVKSYLDGIGFSEQLMRNLAGN